jgi:hypothetical protein
MRGVFDNLSSFHDVIAFLILVLKPSPLRWILFGLLVYIPLQVFFTRNNFRTIDKSSFRPYVEGVTLVETVLRVADPLFLSDLRFNGQTKSYNELELWGRVKWILLYKVSPRGVGWRHEPTHALPKTPALSRKEFLPIKCLHLIAYVLAVDICCLFLRLNPSFLGRSLAYNWAWNFLKNFTRTWVLVYFGFNLGHTALSLVSVGFHFSKPEEWPPFFGPITGAYTVQRFWGYVHLV